MEEAIQFATEKLGLSSLKSQQRRALTSFLQGRDVFMGLPTGYGKSVVFQAAALCTNHLNRKDSSFSIVVMPLKALIRDQIERASKLGVGAADLSTGVSSELQEEIVSGKYSLLLTSPEFLTSDSGRDFIKLDFVQERLCGFFVDESHCVKKWGYSSGKTKAFRSSYSLLGELRSSLPTVPLVAMTATATLDVRKKVLASLGMRNYDTIIESPDNPNIKHVYLETGRKEFDDIFKFVIDEVRQRQENTTRTIIYCNSRKVAAELYGIFCSELPKSCLHYVNMYHTNTEKDVQEQVANDFSDPDGQVRVLIATIAFGMGVDVKGTHSAIILGRPTELDDYLQMAGRIGRDGKDSVSIIVRYPGDIVGHSLSQEMETFLKGDVCRRAVISECFGSPSKPVALHGCCDVCAAKCSCIGDRCGATTLRVEALATSALQSDAQSSCEYPILIPTPSQLDRLQVRLEEYRESLVSDNPDHLYSGIDLASGLPQSTIDLIIRDSNVNLSKPEFFSRYMYAFSSVDIAHNAWNIYVTSLEREDCGLTEENKTSKQTDSEVSDTWSGDEFAEAVFGLSTSESD